MSPPRSPDAARQPPALPPPLRLHGFAPRSRANGPGVRAVVWLQGCTLGCSGCFNPATHPSGPLPDRPEPGGRGVWTAAELFAEITPHVDRIEGITVSGGEPLEQAAGLLAFLTAIRATTSLSVLLFSGHTRAEIARIAHGPAILDQVDVLIDGRYRAGERLAGGLRGSANQEIHLLTGRYRRAEIEATPAAEIVIGPGGEVTITGIDPPRLKL